MIIDGIEFRPVRKHYRVIPDYYVSKCAKVWNSKRKRYVKPYASYRTKKSDGSPPKCMEFSMMVDETVFDDCKYVSKRKDGRLELKIKLHLAVKDAWEPYEDYLNTLSKEELIELAKKTMLVDHVNDNPLDNSLENLNYSDPWNNSNHRKNWVDKG